MELDRDTTLAGWHRDPSGRHELRFWDGDRWTEHVVDGGIPGLDFPTRSGRAPSVASTPAPPLPSDFAGTTEPAADPTVPGDLDLDLDLDLEAEAEAEADAELETALPVIDVTAEAAIDEQADSVAVEPAGAPVTADAGQSTRHGSRGLRTRRRPTAPIQPVPAVAVVEIELEPAPPVMAPAPVAVVEIEPAAVVEAAPIIEPEPAPAVEAAAEAAPNIEPEPAPAVEAAAEAEPEPAPVVEAEPEAAPIIEPKPAAELEPTPEPSRRPEPVRARIESPTGAGPTVASPAGNSAGSNTSAIADPHRAHGTPMTSGPSAPPRVAGVAAVPVKRYRPGSPPPSPFAGPRALPAATGPVGTVIPPWYQNASGWIAIFAIVAVAALVVVTVLAITGDDTSNRLGGRPPAAAPQGSKVIDGDGFGIAAPAGWIVASDTGNSFPQLRHTNWGTPSAATDSENGEGLIVVPLDHLRHNPQVDPELFWTDQVRNAGTTRTITPGPQFGVHGFRANRVTVTDPSGKALVAASIDTGDHTYLVAFTAKTEPEATARFERLIQTFDAR